MPGGHAVGRDGGGDTFFPQDIRLSPEAFDHTVRVETMIVRPEGGMSEFCWHGELIEPLQCLTPEMEIQRIIHIFDGAEFIFHILLE